MAGLALALLCLPAGSALAAPAPGDRDRSFGEDGVIQLTDLSSLRASPPAMAVGPNGAIFVLSRRLPCTTSKCGREPLVTRLRGDGSLDTSYGTDGTAAAFPGVGELSAASDIAVDSQGRAIVATRHGSEVLVTRLDAGGAPDGAFGGVRRIATETAPSQEYTGLSLAVTGADEVVVSAAWDEGQGTGGPDAGLLIARLLPDGGLDPSFGTVGVVRTSVPGAEVSGSTVLARDKSSIMVGRTCCEAPAEPILVRLTADGSQELNFGSHVWHNDIAAVLGLKRGSISTITVAGLFVRRNGRLDVVLTSKPLGSGFGWSSFLLRVRPDGRLDRHFGQNGVRRLPEPAQAAAVDSEGRILVVSKDEPVSGQPQVTQAYRLTPGGRLDRTFGGGHVVLHGPDELSDVIQAAYVGQRPVVLDTRYGECRSACNATAVLVRFRGGTSSIDCLGHQATIVGTSRGETLRGTPRGDVIAALGGRDTVFGAEGNDLICGGPGHDELHGGPGRNRLRQ